MTDRLKFQDTAQEVMYLAGLLYGRLHEGDSLRDLPGCWEQSVPGGLHISLNPHGSPRLAEDGTEVPGHHLRLTFHGRGTALIGPMGGIITGGPSREKLLKEMLARATRRAAALRMAAAFTGKSLSETNSMMAEERGAA